ncbi:hypothetical protein N7510_002686 [Penicillium lagena]|uniref:uncharacterized protein n=1 Tax=Penicillium lagena TaxID=94218 RepID=UPI0025417137|nr:uncharacterized protein N7510_002686 [Penicillium lagena]KAJ5626377.1 hypothetical protein N7510_002686 [Penicillium lagena]
MKYFRNIAEIVLFAIQVVGEPTDRQSSTRSLTKPFEYPASPTFPVPRLPDGVVINTEPNCFYERGLAYMNSTTENIDHLRAVSDDTCGVDAGDCIRVSYTNQSGIFLCNYNSHRISTDCGKLVPLATELQQTCQIDDFYTFGIIRGSFQNHSDRIDYYLTIAGAKP